MSEKLTCDQMREARIRMLGIGREIKDKIAKPSVMDMDDEVTRLRKENDALRKQLDAVCEEKRRLGIEIMEYRNALQSRLFDR